MATWIFQANPALYAISAAVQAKPVIYWRVPQYTDQIDTSDRVLIWRAGKQAGLVGWGVVLAQPDHYDLTQDSDPYIKGLPRNPTDWYAPLRVWAADHIPKDVVSALIPEHRIVTAPMGTVFPVTGDELARLQSLVPQHGFELAREPEPGFMPLPVLTVVEPEPRTKDELQPRATITPAMFLLSSSPQKPVDITIEGDSLWMQLVERDALKTLDESWDAVGIYLLIGRPGPVDAALSVYIGKAQGLRSRIKGHVAKEWTRCLLIQREGLHAFNASDISWLERRLIDVLLEAPEIDLINKTPPPPEAVPDYKAEILERTVVATLGVLAVLGAYVA